MIIKCLFQCLPGTGCFSKGAAEPRLLSLTCSELVSHPQPLEPQLGHGGGGVCVWDALLASCSHLCCLTLGLTSKWGGATIFLWAPQVLHPRHTRRVGQL